MNQEQLSQLAQRREREGRELLRQPESRRQTRFEVLHSSRENSESNDGGGRHRRNRGHASRAGAGPLESDEDDLLNDLDESRPDDLHSDDDEEDLHLDEDEDHAASRSSASPPLASYDNRASRRTGPQRSNDAIVEAERRRARRAFGRMRSGEHNQGALSAGSSDDDRSDSRPLGDDDDDDDASSESAALQEPSSRRDNPLEQLEIYRREALAQVAATSSAAAGGQQ